VLVLGVMSTGTSPIRESAEGRPVDRNGFYLSKVQIDAGVDAAGEPLVMTRLMMDTFRSAARAHTHTHTHTLCLPATPTRPAYSLCIPCCFPLVVRIIFLPCLTVIARLQVVLSLTRVCSPLSRAADVSASGRKCSRTGISGCRKNEKRCVRAHLCPRALLPMCFVHVKFLHACRQ
jgi:hypothetical protein